SGCSRCRISSATRSGSTPCRSGRGALRRAGAAGRDLGALLVDLEGLAVPGDRDPLVDDGPLGERASVADREGLVIGGGALQGVEAGLAGVDCVAGGARGAGGLAGEDEAGLEILPDDQGPRGRGLEELQAAELA